MGRCTEVWDGGFVPTLPRSHLVRLLLPCLLLVAACTPSDDVPVVPFLDTPVQAVSSTLATGTGEAVLAGPGRVLIEDPSGLRLIDARVDGETSYADLTGPVTAAATIDGEILAAVDGALWTLDDTPRPSPLGDALDSPVDTLVASDDALWIVAGEVLRWSRGTLSAVRFDDTPIAGPVFPGAVHADGPVTWVRDADRLVALDASLAAVDVLDVAGSSRLQVAGDGSAWILGEELSIWTPGADGPTVVDAEVLSIAAHPGADAVWVETSDGVFVGDVQGLAPTTVPAGAWLGVDGQGRLLVRSAEGLERVAAGRSVALLDLSETVRGRTVLTVDPSTAEGVSEVLLTLGDVETTLTTAPYRGSLDPAEVGEGSVDVSVRVSWEDGTSARTSLTVEVVDGAPTWVDDVDPIFQASCSSCHSADDARPLDTSEAWQDDFENIFSQVSSGAMPLGLDPLSNDDLDLLSAWEAGGFR